MKPSSIRSHLRPYSIYQKRKTTIAHAFASARAPADDYDEKKVELALSALGQADLRELVCVYCGRIAQTWDHLENLVQNGEPNGYGHQIGNLVPSCRDCNSKKGGKSYVDFIEASSHLSGEQQIDLIRRLKRHQSLSQSVDYALIDPEGRALVAEMQVLKERIFGLMKEADVCAMRLRKLLDR